MKKLVMFMLVMAILLGLCACTEKAPYTSVPTTGSPSVETPPTTAAKPTETTQPTQPPVTQPLEPTPEDTHDMWEYAHIVSALKNYLDTGYIFYSIYDENGESVANLNGQAALQYCYEQLVEMENIDRWIGTEYTDGINWRDEVPEWDRLGFVNGFHVLSDLKLQQNYVLTKKDGSTESGTESSWSYDSNGALVSIDGIQNMFETIQSVPVFPGNFTVYFSYNDNAAYSQILYGSNTYATAIPTYDASGKINSMAVSSRDDSCVVEYSYSGDLLTKISWTEYGYPVEIEYTYGGDGNVITSVYTEYTGTDNLGNNQYPHQRIIFEYTYNGSQLVSATRTTENWSWEWDEAQNYEFFVELETTDNYNFTSDDRGRLSTIAITYGDSVWAHGDNKGTVCRKAEYQSKHIQMVYGGYYFYQG